jgi:hypothetical protein
MGLNFQAINLQKSRALVAAWACSTVLGLSGAALADSIPITNPDFTTDASGWTVAHSFGSAGQYDASLNPEGSTSSSPYSVGGDQTGLTGYPIGVTTAGGFTMDAYDEANPSSPNPPPNPNNANISATARDPGTGALNWSSVRISSGNGDLGSLYQDAGITFLANTTYTLTAYAAGNSGQTGLDEGPSPFSNTGVGLSGGSPLTMSEISAALGVYNNWGNSSEPTLVERTLTIDTADSPYSGLVGQDIIVNLLADTIATGGGTAQSFTGVILTSAADAPEPASVALLMLGGVTLVMRRRAKRA